MVAVGVDIDDLIRRIRTAFTDGRLPEAVALLDQVDDVELDEIDRLKFARVRGVTLSRAGQNAAALTAMNGVASAWLERDEPVAAVTVSSLEAYVHNRLGDLDEALDAGAWTLMLLDELDGVESSVAGPVNVLLAATRNTMGLMFLDLEAVDLAIGEFSRALQLVGHDDPVMVGIARANLASAFLRKALRHRSSDGSIEGADNELAGAERLAREILASDRSPRRRIEAASILAAVLMNTDRFEEAADLLDRYIVHEHLVDDARAMVDWNLLVARAHRRFGRLLEAQQRVGRAVQFAERSGDRIVMSLAVRERSRVREAMGDVVGALGDLRAADDGSRTLRSGRFEALVEQLMRRAQLEASRRRLEREAEHFGAERRRLTLASETDPLTGVGNRRGLTASLDSIAAGPERVVSVVMLDIDRFKEANDALGHAFGDRILVDVAATLTSLARERDVLCRPGGDEFVLVLPGVDLDGARAVADRIRNRVAALRWTSPDDGLETGLSVSIGISGGQSPEVAALIDTADDGLLLAKRYGRDRIVVGRPLGDRPGTPASGLDRPSIPLG